MGQIDRIRADLQAIADRHTAPGDVQREVQKRIERFVADATEFYADEPNGNARLRKDLSVLGDALLAESDRGLPGPLARAFDYAFEAVSAKLHARRNGA